jgi:diguanylate cyclase (GGDEF)-like protein
MTESDLKTEQPPAVSPSPARRWRRPIPPALSILLEIAVASIPVTGVVWIIGWFGKESKLDVWICLTIAGAGALLASCWGTLVRRRFWSRPARTLLNAVDLARQGELPVEDLSLINGHMAPLARSIQEVLRLAKLQKAELQEMEREVQGRIANNTDALERKIGSLRHQAMRDALTGLQNRRSMEQELPRVLAEHRAGAIDACLLMIDVDHFKLLNDTLGHVAGDNLLKEIGQIIRSTIRDKDVGFRCGGDEFVVLLNQAGPTIGLEVAKRLESLVEVLTRTLRLQINPQLSIGVCALSELAEPSPQAWLDVTDKRLYAVKAARGAHRKAETLRLKKSA